MTNTPEIERLSKIRDEHRNEIRRIEAELKQLRRDERQRIVEARHCLKRKKREDEVSNKVSAKIEPHRLRVLLADEMRANGKKWKEIENILGVKVPSIRLSRWYLERYERRKHSPKVGVGAIDKTERRVDTARMN